MKLTPNNKIINTLLMTIFLICSFGGYLLAGVISANIAKVALLTWRDIGEIYTVSILVIGLLGTWLIGEIIDRIIQITK